MTHFKDQEKFTYIWEIKNMQYSTLKTGDRITSPLFTVPQIKNTKWYLGLYPRGDSEEFKNYTSCHVFRENDSGPESIEVTYILSLSSKDITLTSKRNFKKKLSWGYSGFIPHQNKNYKAYEKSVIIMCEILLPELCNSREECHPENFPSSKLGRSYYLEVSKDEELDNTDEQTPQSPTKNYFTIPTKLFVQTEVLHETKSILKCLNSLINSSNPEHVISLTLPEKHPYPSITIDLKKDCKANINIHVRLTNGNIKQPLLVICKPNILNSLGQMLHTSEEKHIFTTEKTDEIWDLEKSIEKSDFIKELSDFSLNEIILKLDFIFSINKTKCSKIIKAKYINVPKYFVIGNEYAVSDQTFRLYKIKKLCDVVLKIGESSFHAHKTILGGASLVFAAMFTNEMAEQKNNVVNIVDLDKDTVEEMVSFIYTGAIKELDYNSAQKLFVAGDKYQILPLLNLCRNIMISHISTATICQIISIADIHNDIVLEKATVKFCKLNKSTVISSCEWEKFEEENVNLAYKVLRQVCLLHKGEALF